MALDRRPWLILTDIRMPGAGGLEFCRRVRSHSLIRQTPLLFLSGLDDYRQRYRALEMGADDFISKQTSLRELLIRIQLLMKRYADLSTRGAGGAGMEGELAVIGAPGVLQMCHLSLLTGVLAAYDGARPARVRFRSGEIVGAECDGAEGADALFAFVGWSRGRFRFEPRDPGDGVPLGRSFDGVLLEACRRLDEANRAAAQEPPPAWPGDPNA
jgi:CheY-like chemotaxis protein